jgi:hypothetical protein
LKRRTTKGKLHVKALEYAPWIDHYTNARKALPFYVIAESIRRGYGGAFSIDVRPEERLFYESLGFQQVPGTDRYDLPAHVAYRLVLEEEGVSDEVTSLLEDRVQKGTADLAWIVLKLSRKNITPQMVEQITIAKSGISWVTLQAYVEQPKAVSMTRIQILERKLRDLFGQLEVVEFLKSLDPGITFGTEERLNIKGLAEIIAIVSRDVEVPGNRVFNSQAQRIESQVLVLRQGQRFAVKAKAWHKYTYYSRSRNVKQLCWEVRQVASKLCTIVVVTEDFLDLEDQKQQTVVRDITASGGRLVVLKGISACNIAQNTARFLYDLSRK